MNETEYRNAVCSQLTRWDLGTCVPEDLLYSSDLTERQKKIESVSLTTDGSCGKDYRAHYFVNLKEFKDIRSLSWRGINEMSNFHSLRECIKVNEQRIETLVLDLIDWREAEHKYYVGLKRTTGSMGSGQIYNFFAQDILGLVPGDEKTILPHLSTLSLSAVSFQDVTEEMLHALNICRLCSLRLWNCPHSLDLLQTIVGGAHNVTLKSFELVADVDCYYKQQTHVIVVCAFLNAFRGLEDLYLMLTPYMNWGRIGQSILGHVVTLDRLAIHEREDVGGLEWTDHVDSHISLSDGLADLYQNTNLTCIGICPEHCDWVRTTA